MIKGSSVSCVCAVYWHCLDIGENNFLDIQVRYVLSFVASVSLFHIASVILVANLALTITPASFVVIGHQRLTTLLRYS